MDSEIENGDDRELGTLQRVLGQKGSRRIGQSSDELLFDVELHRRSFEQTSIMPDPGGVRSFPGGEISVLGVVARLIRHHLVLSMASRYRGVDARRHGLGF